MVALLFPGQGSQELGMGQELAQAFPEARAVFDEVDDALGQSLTSVMWGEDLQTLTATANAQPAIMATSVAAYRALESVAGASETWSSLPSVAAGHSLGEYSAHVIAGSFDLATAARLLRIRGNAMQDAVAPGEGAMAAILNVEMSTLEQICADSVVGAGCCQIANDNAPGQIVISGDLASVERAMAAATAAGAKRCVLLPVSAPFHCALMQPAQDAMAEALAAADITDATLPVLCNVDAKPIQKASETRDTLVRQVTGRVRWVDSVQTIASGAEQQALELGHGKVLAGLNRRIAKDLATHGVGTPAAVEAAAASLNA